MQTKIVEKKKNIKSLGDNFKSFVSPNLKREGEYDGVCFIPAQNVQKTFIAKPSSVESNVVIMHFNDEISLQFHGDEQITNEFIDKALQEMQLINLKRSMKHSNFDTQVKPAACNTIIAREQKGLEIFDYQSIRKDEFFNSNVVRRLNDIKANQSVAPMRGQQGNAIQLMSFDPVYKRNQQKVKHIE